MTVPSPADLRQRVSARWQGLQAWAVRTYEAAIQANPSRFRETVEGFVRLLAQVRADLDRIQTLAASLDEPALRDRVATLEARYATLAAGVFTDAQPTDGVGAAPVVIGVVVAGMVVGVAGIAWAVAAYQYAVNLREHTALLVQELEARVEASRAGRALVPSSIAASNPAAASAPRAGLWLLGSLAVAAAALTLPVLLKKAA